MRKKLSKIKDVKHDVYVKELREKGKISIYAPFDQGMVNPEKQYTSEKQLRALEKARQVRKVNVFVPSNLLGFKVRIVKDNPKIYFIEEEYQLGADDYEYFVAMAKSEEILHKKIYSKYIATHPKIPSINILTIEREKKYDTLNYVRLRKKNILLFNEKEAETLLVKSIAEKKQYMKRIKIQEKAKLC